MKTRELADLIVEKLDKKKHKKHRMKVKIAKEWNIMREIPPPPTASQPETSSATASQHRNRLAIASTYPPSIDAENEMLASVHRSRYENPQRQSERDNEDDLTYRNRAEIYGAEDEPDQGDTEPEYDPNQDYIDAEDESSQGETETLTEQVAELQVQEPRPSEPSSSKGESSRHQSSSNKGESSHKGSSSSRHKHRDDKHKDDKGKRRR